MVHQHTGNRKTPHDNWLVFAVAINMVLTLAQVIGGILSGSLALIADALHNFSDAGALLLAWIARRISRRPADAHMTFGYGRAEIIAALINLTTLILIGLYLLYEAILRFYKPQIIEGWMVVIVAAIALVIDTLTALLTWKMSNQSLNIRAAFLHNLSDALASAGVILSGSLILAYQWYWSDTLLTLLIAGYVLYQAATLLPQTVRILMQATPEGIALREVVAAMEEIPTVIEVHHVHIWQLDEQNNALEAHVRISDSSHLEATKAALKKRLEKEFGITHASLEFETAPCSGEQKCQRP